MLWHSCLLALALCGVATAQVVQPPSNLQESNIGPRTVSYTFTASPTQGATYSVTFTPQRDGIPQPRTVTGTGVFYTTSGLTPDVTYRLQVVAVLNGVQSTPISVDFTTLPDVPTGPPQGLTVSDRTTTSITLTWRDPTLDKINDRDGVTGFVVRRDRQQVAMVTVPTRTYDVTELTIATSYDFEVLAVNEQGVAPDNHAAELTASTASGIPNPPILRVVLPRFSQTLIAWRDPEPFVGAITGVEILYLIDNNPQNISELSNGETQYSVSGIKGSEGKTHSVSLRAKTSAGYGAYSDPVVFIFQPIVEAVVEATDCDTLQVMFTVYPLPNPLPNGNNTATLQSLEVTYRPVVGGGSTETRSFALNGSGVGGVLCITGLTTNTGYRVTYNVEVNTPSSVTLLTDLSAPAEVPTLSNCVVQGQCTETSSIITTPPPPTSTPGGGTGAAVSVMSTSATLIIAISLVVALVLQMNTLQ